MKGDELEKEIIIFNKHMDSLPILISFLKKMCGHKDKEVRKLAYKALSDWDKARG